MQVYFSVQTAAVTSTLVAAAIAPPGVLGKEGLTSIVPYLHTAPIQELCR